MNIYKGRFLPDNSTVANDANTPISKVSREWCTNLENSNIHSLKPSLVKQRKLDMLFDNDEHTNIRYARDEPVEFDDEFKS